MHQTLLTKKEDIWTQLIKHQYTSKNQKQQATQNKKLPQKKTHKGVGEEIYTVKNLIFDNFESENQWSKQNPKQTKSTYGFASIQVLEMNKQKLTNGSQTLRLKSQYSYNPSKFPQLSIKSQIYNELIITEKAKNSTSNSTTNCLVLQPTNPKTIQTYADYN